MAAPSKLAYLRAIHKTICADVIRGDKEMAAPAQFFQPPGDMRVGAHPAVVECDHPFSRTSWGPRASGDYVGYDGRTFANTRDGSQVFIEDADLQLVQRGVRPVKTARFVRAAFDDVVVYQRDHILRFNGTYRSYGSYGSYE